MANDGEDGNGLEYEFLKKRQDVSFSKVQVFLENRWNFEQWVAVRTFSKKLHLIIYFVNLEQF